MTWHVYIRCSCHIVTYLDATAGDELGLDLLLEDLHSLESTDIDMNGGGTTLAPPRTGTPVRGRSSNTSDATTLRKKITTQTKAIQTLQMQLRQEQEQAMAWRQK